MEKLLIEIELHNGKCQDAVSALIHLANEILESSIIILDRDEQWETHQSDDYTLRWRFDEDSPPAREMILGDYDLLISQHARRRKRSYKMTSTR